MRIRYWTVIVGTSALFCLAAQARAQLRFGLPTASELAGQDTYVAPKIGADYAMRLAAQPDLQGHWIGTGQGFDPDHYHISYEVERSATFSANPGSYLNAIPYKAEYQKQYMQAVADAVAGKDRDTFALCKPYGMPRFMRSPAGFDLLQSPDIVVMQDNYDNETRRLFLDGRPHPSPVGAEDSDARTYTGHSVGHFEADTLVVDTVNIVAGFYDDTLAPHSNQLHLTERLRLIGKDLLKSTMVIEDPVMFTQPWEVTRYYRRVLVSGVESQAGTTADQKLRRYRFHNLLDHPCETTIDMSKGYQSLILPQEIDAKKASGGATK